MQLCAAGGDDSRIYTVYISASGQKYREFLGENSRGGSRGGGGLHGSVSGGGRDTRDAAVYMCVGSKISASCSLCVCVCVENIYICVRVTVWSQLIHTRIHIARILFNPARAKRVERARQLLAQERERDDRIRAKRSLGFCP